MSGILKLDRKVPIEITALQGKKIAPIALCVEGAGKILACLVGFYKKGDSVAKHEEIFFHLPDYRQSQTLPAPLHQMDISAYDTCEIKILSGSLHSADEVVFIYKIIRG